VTDTPVPWIDGLTIGQALAHTARRYPDQDAAIFVQTGVRFTWRQFDDAVTAVARALVALGIRKGEHVAVWGTNVPQWVLLQFATARIGAVFVTVNPAYRPFELEYVLKQSDAVAMFLVDQFKSSDYFAMLAEVCPALSEARDGAVSSSAFPKLRRVVSMKGSPPEGILPWAEFLRRGEATPRAEIEECASHLDPSDPINIQYTSGTTGFPKAAMLSHRNLLYNAYYIGECQDFTAQDRICIPVPFYHCFGCVLGTLCCSVYGSAMIIPAEYFQPKPTLDALEQERCTALYGVPTMFIAQLQDPSFAGRTFPHLRTGIMSGAPCPIEIMRQLGEKLNVRELTIAYGQTEASPVITQTRTNDPIELRVETVGRPLPGVEVKIVDAESGRDLPDNEQGELCARGHVVMLGYYNDPAATARVIDPQGWLHTGDVALRLPSGYYKITGRMKDMVIRGGENIYPREIEEFLFRHPAVEQVAVVGVPDLKYGEELCAWIKLKAGAQATSEEIRQFCKQHLAHYKTPRYIKFVENFPQTVTGKIQKFKIREQMIAELGLNEQKTA
jgi:fatty-acyl-CoA synthase